MKVIITVILCSLIKYSYTARILCVFNMPATSHYLIGNTYARALAEAGHDVTMISPYEDTNPTKNGSYRNILLTGYLDDPEKTREKRNYFARIYRNPFLLMYVANKIGLTLTKKTLEHPNVQNLIKSNETFDVVVFEQFFNDGLKGLATHFKGHQIILSPIGSNIWVNHFVGNPHVISYLPDLFTGYSFKMNFFQRCYNFLVTVIVKTGRYFWVYRKQEQLMKQYIPNAPDIEDVLYNTSLVLLNSDPCISFAMPKVPNMIEIGGFHIKSQKLPDDIKQFMDDADHGVIFFSMGSTIKGVHMPEEKRREIMNTFRKLPQRVLWKWESDELPDKPDNVKIVKWVPQQGVLAHPNIKLYICHGGILSITEAVYHGVPLILIPIFGDQPMNANVAENNGLGLTLHFNELSEKKLALSINEILSNSRYKNTVMMRSKAFQNKPISPLESAVYWTEYVINHNGAEHLKVYGRNLNFIQYYLLDVYFTIFTVLFAFIYIITMLCSKIFHCKKIKLD